MRPSVPAPGAEPRSEPAELETRGNQPAAPSPAHASPLPFRGDPTPPPRPPLARPDHPNPLVPLPAQVHVRHPASLPPRHIAGRPWHEDTLRRTGELGTEWGA